MSSRWRRFEVLLPLQFNDGRTVPADWLAKAVLEITVSLAHEIRARVGRSRPQERAGGTGLVGLRDDGVDFFRKILNSGKIAATSSRVDQII